MTTEAVPPAPESASQRRRAEGKRNDALVLRALAAAGDAGLRGPEVAAMSGLPERTARATLARLKLLRLVAQDGQRGSVRATMEGRDQVGVGTPGLALTAALEAAIGHFPAEAQRAFVRLLLSGIVARHHLSQDYPEGWGGFIIVGPTKTAKTSLAAFACRVFDISGAVRVLRDETPGSIFGRRQQAAGGQWTITPSQLLALPFLCLDEFDKAPDEVRREAARLLLGQTEVEVEGERFRVRPVPLVVLNARPAELGQRLHEAYVRRSPVLDTGELGGLLGDVDEDMRKLFTDGTIPHLELDALRPPPKLSEADRVSLRSALRKGLTEDGWRLVDVEAISRLALGRSPLMGTDPDLAQACLATALDYLIVTQTLPGRVRPRAIAELAPKLGGIALMVPDVETHLSQQATVARVREDSRAAELAEGAAFVADRAKLKEELLLVVAGLGRRRDPEASAVKAALRKLAKGAEGCRSREAMGDINAAALPYREQARALLARWEAEAQRAEQAKRDAAAQREQAAWNRRQAAGRRGQEQRDAKARRAAERNARMQWAKALRALYRMTPYASLGAALDGLVTAGWLETEWPATSGLWAALTRFSPQYRVKVAHIQGWPVDTVVDQIAVGDFWAAACIHAEREAGSAKAGQRPVWQSTLAVQQAREKSPYLRKLGL